MRNIFLVTLIALIGIAGCAHTGISRIDDCGDFSSTVVGVPPFYTPAGQYERYALACGTERFSRVIAAQRQAIVAGAYAAAANSGRDIKARKEIAKTQRAVRALAGAVGDIAQAGEGGAR